MKNIAMILFCLLFLLQKTDAQILGTDKTSNQASLALIAAQKELAKREAQLQKQLQELIKSYTNRLDYETAVSTDIASTDYYKDRIVKKANNMKLRVATIKQNNDSLPAQNRKRKIFAFELDLMKDELQVIDKEVIRFISAKGIIGEKENLYQNYARRMHKMDRKMDALRIKVEQEKRDVKWSQYHKKKS